MHGNSDIKYKVHITGNSILHTHTSENIKCEKLFIFIMLALPLVGRKALE